MNKYLRAVTPVKLLIGEKEGKYYDISTDMDVDFDCCLFDIHGINRNRLYEKK